MNRTKLGVLAFVAMAACAPFVSHAEKTVPLVVPDEASIPTGPVGDAVRRGKQLLTDTHKQLPKNVGNGLNCTNCHLNGGTTAYASPCLLYTSPSPRDA